MRSILSVGDYNPLSILSHQRFPARFTRSERGHCTYLDLRNIMKFIGFPAKLTKNPSKIIFWGDSPFSTSLLILAKNFRSPFTWPLSALRHKLGLLCREGVSQGCTPSGKASRYTKKKRATPLVGVAPPLAGVTISVIVTPLPPNTQRNMMQQPRNATPRLYQWFHRSYKTFIIWRNCFDWFL